jgi:predicted alpha/beta-fold hydrolase
MKKFYPKLKEPFLKKNIDLDKCLKNLKYCTDIDNEITAPFFGYKDS